MSDESRDEMPPVGPIGPFSQVGPLAPVGPVHPGQVRAVRLGHGANCSSIGSVVDTLFVASAVAGAVLAAVAAALNGEGIRVVGVRAPASPDDKGTRAGHNAHETGEPPEGPGGA